MAAYKYPKPVKLVIGFLAESQVAIEQILPSLIKKFGHIDHSMPSIYFEHTNYYDDEIGSNPIKSFISFVNLIPREEIVNIKRFTNDLELKSFGGQRKVNIDPGYMTQGQFFLATTKDQRHRIYVKDGVFVETTLYFENKTWKYFDWTYYDYRSSEYHKFFYIIRNTLTKQLKEIS
jgi:hypothetical protein